MLGGAYRDAVGAKDQIVEVAMDLDRNGAKLKKVISDVEALDSELQLAKNRVRTIGKRIGSSLGRSFAAEFWFASPSSASLFSSFSRSPKALGSRRTSTTSRGALPPLLPRRDDCDFPPLLATRGYAV